jgi:radical SAM protein with 4Fe4S-binding SPASM domain
MSRETAEFLYAEGASVLFKLDSLDEHMQDYLSGKKGTHRRIREGMKNLLSVGFNKPQDGYLRCGASFVLTKINYKEIPALWRFCRDNRLYPNLEEFIPRNRGLKRMQEFWVDKKEVRRLKQELLKIDCAYGYDWLIYTPLSGHGCLQPLYSVYVACDGYVRPCADIDVRLFNIRDMDIPEIIKTPFFHFARNIEKHLQGRCYQCEHNYLCIGCRGNAFCVGTNEGLGVYEALCREDPLCWKRNPKKKPRAWN